MGRSNTDKMLGMTVRLADGRGTLSLDDGTTFEVPEAIASEISARLRATDQLIASADGELLTAAAQATLAEARVVRPTDQRQTGFANAARLLGDFLTDKVSEHDPTRDQIAVTDLGPSQPLAQVFMRRQSIRQLGPVSHVLIGTVMARVSLTRRHWLGIDGFIESSRPVPSAGARHPHALVLLAQRVEGLESGTWVLDPDSASLRRSGHGGAVVRRALDAVVDALRLTDAPPAVVFTVALPRLTLDRYPSGMALLWRDAGVLLGALHLAACDLGLGSCIAGTSGVLFPSDGKAATPVDTGAIAIGTLPRAH